MNTMYMLKITNFLSAVLCALSGYPATYIVILHTLGLEVNLYNFIFPQNDSICPILSFRITI
jgi:hypothetical protein